MKAPKLQSVIAATVIHRMVEPGVRADKVKGTPAVRPKTRMLAVGTVFKPRNQDEMDSLWNLNAIRLITDEDTIPVRAMDVANDEDEDESDLDEAKTKSAPKPAPKSGKAKAAAKKPSAAAAKAAADKDSDDNDDTSNLV